MSLNQKGAFYHRVGDTCELIAVITTHIEPDVETVIVDGGVLRKDSEVKTLNADTVRDNTESTVDRFASEADWEPGIGGFEPPKPYCMVSEGVAAIDVFRSTLEYPR